jgi:hypothetical protein
MNQIYQQEILDGLESALSNNVISYCAIASIDSGLDINFNTMKQVQHSLTASEKEQPLDLYQMSSVLVSTGWNKNDDVFDSKETWEARSTPEDKPFNYMHNEMDIIGHITANRVVDFDGNAIPEGLESPPVDFEIITDGVIYKSWSNLEQNDRINTLIQEIKEGKWYVSMECLFPNFDYALLDSSGQTKLIKRSEASAFLTKHLRAYGGSGLYEDYKVGRLLRNISFSGKGLVSKPANPRSVILEGNKSFDESNSQILTVSSIKEKYMSDSNESKVTELQTALEQAAAENKNLLEKIAAEKENDFESKLQSLESVLAEKNEEISSIKQEQETFAASYKEATEQVEAMKKEMETKEEAMKEMKKKAMRMERKAQLEEAGLDSEATASALDSFDGIDADAFEAVVAMLKKQAEAGMPPELKEAIEKKKEKEEDKKTKAEQDVEVDSAEASEEILDSVENVEVAVASYEDQDDPAESLRATASEVFASVLKSTPKNN